MSESVIPVSHYGVVRFGDLECEAVLLQSGERGYVRRQIVKVLGLHENNTGHRFRQILADFAPKALSALDKSDSPILLPNGRRLPFFPGGVITQVAAGVLEALARGDLHRARQRIVPSCIATIRALATTDELALIDEATGQQYRRSPDALQDLISRRLRSAHLQGGRRAVWLQRRRRPAARPR